MQLLSQPAGRRGYTIVELLIALVMASVLCFGVLKVFMTTQRFSDVLAQKVDVQQNLRTAMAILPSELRQLDAADGDIKGMAADSITIRAMRQVAVVCTAPAMGVTPLTGRTIVVRTPLYSGALFVVGDSFFVWNEGNAASRNDDGWVRGRVTAVANVNCTDGTAGQRLTADLQTPPFAVPQVNIATGVPLGAPLRGFETVTYKVRQAADTRWYLHLTTTNGAGTTGPTPIVGPLVGSTGVVFTYFTSAGAATALPAQVAQVGVVVRGQSLRQVHLPGPAVGFKAESLSTRVTLRNNPRF
jgi:type II secretory pathway pseudopilin PulG